MPSNAIINGLLSGQNYFFRAASLSADGNINWSVTKKYIVQ
ncbi:MAG: hypothetical protein SGJ10_11050 [Bacteroidota bacterium]|nr:hypothetical protein [Bacteroidota bacterium]